MLELMAQAASGTPTPLQSIPTKVPGPEDFVLNLLTDFQSIDIFGIVKGILIAVVVVWLFFAVWVLLDAAKRYHQWYIPLLWFLFVLPVNIVGLVAYMAMRPALTQQEKEWSELELKYLQYELMSTATCPECHHLINPDHAYCSHCGAHLRWSCDKCKKENLVTSKFCVHCGSEKPHQDEGSPEVSARMPKRLQKVEVAAPEKEKRQIRIKKVNVWGSVKSFWHEYFASWRWIAQQTKNKIRPRTTKEAK